MIKWRVRNLEVFEAIRGRRSIRAFENREVPYELVERLIEAARWTPSAGNIQPWEFIIVKKPEIKRKLAEAALGQSFIGRSAGCDSCLR